MARDGYARMSMEELASLAGVSKPTVYLRYPHGKAEVATAALALLRESSDVEEIGETRDDLVLHLERFRRGVERPFGMAMLGTVLAEEHHTPELLRLFREGVVMPRRRLLRGVLERAADRGELRDEADLEGAVNLLIGSYYAAYLAGGRPKRTWTTSTVDAVLAGIRA